MHGGLYVFDVLQVSLLACFQKSSAAQYGLDPRVIGTLGVLFGVAHLVHGVGAVNRVLCCEIIQCGRLHEVQRYQFSPATISLWGKLPVRCEPLIV